MLQKVFQICEPFRAIHACQINKDFPNNENGKINENSKIKENGKFNENGKINEGRKINEYCEIWRKK